jgi:hypothetical protein
MKKIYALGILFALAVFANAIFISDVSAQKATENKENTAQVVSTTLVISQVYGGGGGSTGTYLFDYVEIKNISATPQSLNGLSLYYGSALGNFASSAGNAFALPNVTLNPGQYYFVQTGPTGSAGAAFPVTPDVVTGNLTMSATSGKVALATSALAINTCGATATPCSATQLGFLVDWVAYGAAGNGTAGNGEGGTAVNNGGAMTSSQGSVRKGAGCIETDNNNADFDVVTAPVPRNLSTAAAPCSAVPTTDAPVDFNGDGKTDFAVVRNTGGGPSGQITWLTSQNGSGAATYTQWGIATDIFVPADYDGDGKDDVAVWRGGTEGTSYYYILNSSNNTFRADNFGLSGDDPKVVGDYDGDGKDDPAIYRSGATAGAQSFWAFRASTTGILNIRQWGQNGDFPAPGDYDGDGKYDLAIQRNNGGGQARFWIQQSSNLATSTTVFGTPTDVVVPGDYDGDGKTDIATIRGSGGKILWFYQPSSTGSGFASFEFGTSATDFPTQGDYDGDGKTDIAVFRPNVDPTMTFFYVRGSATGNLISNEWGQNGDYPVANYNSH